MIARESTAVQRDRLRSVLLVLQGRQTLEVTATVGRSRAFVQRRAYAYRDGGIEAVQGRTAPGRRRRLALRSQAAMATADHAAVPAAVLTGTQSG